MENANFCIENGGLLLLLVLQVGSIQFSPFLHCKFNDVEFIVQSITLHSRDPVEWLVPLHIFNFSLRNNNPFPSSIYSFYFLHERKHQHDDPLVIAAGDLLHAVRSELYNDDNISFSGKADYKRLYEKTGINFTWIQITKSFCKMREKTLNKSK